MIITLFLLHYFCTKGIKARPMNCECQVLSQVKHGRAIGLDKVGGVLQSPLKFLILLSGVDIYTYQLT
ncbi:hypothetical protein ERO13_A12G010250v2 [Gossypium hirsutum]|nr:hypothetical protein ERO13_A12G010250v2 [Gossypium hirsutum]